MLGEMFLNEVDELSPDVGCCGDVERRIEIYDVASS